MAATAPAKPAPVVLPLAEWAQRAGKTYLQAWTLATRGYFDGTSAEQPRGWQDDRGRWFIAPGLWEPRPDLQAVADALRQLAAALDGIAIGAPSRG